MRLTFLLLVIFRKLRRRLPVEHVTFWNVPNIDFIEANVLQVTPLD